MTLHLPAYGQVARDLGSQGRLAARISIGRVSEGIGAYGTRPHAGPELGGKRVVGRYAHLERKRDARERAGEIRQRPIECGFAAGSPDR
ncbi:hypothetical protein D3C87_1111460 [compost metagenome]